MRRWAAPASTVNIALCTSALRTRIGMVSKVPAIVCWDSGMGATVTLLLGRQLRPDLAGQVDGGVVGVGSHQGQHGDLDGVRAPTRRELDHAAGEEAHPVRARRSDLGEAGFGRRK